MPMSRFGREMLFFLKRLDFQALFNGEEGGDKLALTHLGHSDRWVQGTHLTATTAQSGHANCPMRSRLSCSAHRMLDRPCRQGFATNE